MDLLAASVFIIYLKSLTKKDYIIEIDAARKH